MKVYYPHPQMTDNQKNLLRWYLGDLSARRFYHAIEWVALSHAGVLKNCPDDILAISGEGYMEDMTYGPKDDVGLQKMVPQPEDIAVIYEDAEGNGNVMLTLGAIYLSQLSGCILLKMKGDTIMRMAPPTSPRKMWNIPEGVEMSLIEEVDELLGDEG